MAISYSLVMATPASLTGVTRELIDVARRAGLFDPSITVEQVLEDGVGTSRGTWIHVIQAEPKPWDSVIRDFGFTPTVRVVFGFKKTEPDEQDDDMIRLVSGLLDRFPDDDVILHFQFEEVWLLRRGNELSVSEDDELWPPHRLAMLNRPYDRVTHSFSME